jgi:pilus assembly protein FimV
VRKIYTLALALSLMLLSPSGWALGLGDIKVTSKLGEQFNATIQITDSSDMDMEQIKTSNASNEIYQLLNVDNSFIYQSFKLNISNVNGKMLLTITTPDSIREPYLNFVITAKWPSGQINKEFKVLIDP